MRHTTTTSDSQAGHLPRGWLLVGAALVSWALAAGLWTGASQLFALVLAAF